MSGIRHVGFSCAFTLSVLCGSTVGKTASFAGQPGRAALRLTRPTVCPRGVHRVPMLSGLRLSKIDYALLSIIFSNAPVT
jgi:hypothetical protein